MQDFENQTHPATQVENALQRYRALNDDLKTILRLRALAFFPVCKPGFRKIATGVPPSVYGSSRYIAGARIEEISQALREQGLLRHDLTCPPDLALPIALDAAADKNGPRLVRACGVREINPRERHIWSREDHFRVLGDCLRRMRIALFSNDPKALREAQRDLSEATQAAERRRGYILREEIPAPEHAWQGVEAAPEWLASRHPAIFGTVLGAKLDAVLDESWCPPGMRKVLEEACRRPEQSFSSATLWKLRLWRLLSGKWTEPSPAAVPEGLDPFWLYLDATHAFLQGKHDRAIELFREGMDAFRKAAKFRYAFPEGSTDLVHLLALLAANDKRLLSDAENWTLVAAGRFPALEPGYLAISSIICLLRGREPAASVELGKCRQLNEKIDNRCSPLSLFCFALAEHLLAGERLHTTTETRLIDIFERLREAFPVLAHCVSDVLSARGLHRDACAAWVEKTGRPAGLPISTDLISVEPAWERRLDTVLGQLVTIQAADTDQVSRVGEKRLAWYVNLNTKEITVGEQTWQKHGRWSAGRTLALRRLEHPDHRLRYLTVADRNAIHIRKESTGHIRKESTGWYADEVRLVLEPEKVLPALVGHPAVFDARDRRRQLDLVKGELVLTVREVSSGGFLLCLSYCCDEPDVFLEQEIDNRYQVVAIDPAAVRLASVIGHAGLRVPEEGKERVLDLCRMAVPSVAIRADFAEAEDESQPGDPQPVLRIIPLDEGLRVSLHVRPLGADGPYFSPGRGPRMIAASVQGKHLRAARTMREEKKQARALIEACPSLGDPDAGMKEWIFDDLESSLEIMLEIQNAPSSLRVEWPEKAVIPFAKTADSRSIQAKIRAERDWFALSGEITVDEDLVVGMDELLEALDQAHGRFVPLSNGRFLALTEQFRQQLQRLKAISSGCGKLGERLSPLGTLAVRDLLEETGRLRSDSSWRTFRKRIANAERHQPGIPGTLQAELRDYQREGYIWSSRLAVLGAGACLADDMGLGKTVQALALLLERASGGPALVIAPTSVCPNWESEARRFAPTLNLHRFDASMRNTERIGELGEHDVLVASYGMIDRHLKALQDVSWHTLAIDEAQAVKNPEARRTKAVASLRADFRIALTGTPIENNLEELWSLFRILNPGLLGSRASFRKRFLGADPRRTADARASLRALIRPFVLRRTKSMVLSELPERTEQIIRIELGDEEQAFHEALRRQAVERLSHLDEENAGRRRVQILSEITRLRRACCHPRLIDENSNLPGAKLEALLGIVDTIIAGRHRALVFSQFTSHLAMVRPRLDQAGVRYQYLDGSTPSRQREERIRAFQSGVGDLFLISLRAGGTGLNLTAADYVMHLDPWWNPAVEDQASDRAHRIVQERPVTVYNLFDRGSIEERMLDLHREKRDLADELLAGTETAVCLREEDLLNLIALT